MNRLLSIVLALFLASCSTLGGGNPAEGVVAPTIKSEMIVETQIQIDLPQWAVWTQLMRIDKCTTNITVVSLQGEPLTYTLDGGWRVNGDTTFDLNLGVLAACMAEKLGGIYNGDSINQAIAMTYAYVAKGSGYDYEKYATGVQPYGKVIPEEMYDTLFLGVKVNPPVSAVAKPMKVQP